MTDPKPYIKWFYRCTFLLLVGLMAYVVFQPHYNFAHWVPHSQLRNMGVPYSVILHFESNADKLLHPIGGFVLTVLLIVCKWPLISHPRYRLFVLFCSAMLITECIQWTLGRGFEFSDLLLGVLGSFLAYKFYPNS